MDMGFSLLSKYGRLAFGGAAVAGAQGGYSFAGLDESQAQELLRGAFELGVRVFDSAPVYGFGQSERRIGQALREVRQEVFITTKSGVSWNPDHRIERSNDPQLTQKMLDQSLKDLASDYIDLYMIHWPDPAVDIRRPMEVLSQAKALGQIRHIGLSNTNLEDLSKALEIDSVEVVQSQLNPFATESTSLLDFTRRQGISFQSWGTLDKGILSGTVGHKREMGKDYAAGDARKKAPWWNRAEVLKKIECVEKIRPVLQKYECSLLQWALGHNLVEYGIEQVIIGSRSLAQLKEVLSTLEDLPSRETLAAIQREWEQLWPAP